MNPTAAIPISHEPHLRSRSTVADREPSAVMVAMTDHLLHWAKTPAPPRPLPVRGDAMSSPLLTSIPWEGQRVSRRAEMDRIATRDRSKEAYQELVHQELPGLYSLARRLERDGAEDLVQEALLQGYRAFWSLKQQAAGGRWLKTILVNVFRDELRKRGRRVEEVAVGDLEDFSLYRTLIDEGDRPAPRRSARDDPRPTPPRPEPLRADDVGLRRGEQADHDGRRRWVRRRPRSLARRRSGSSGTTSTTRSRRRIRRGSSTTSRSAVGAAVSSSSPRRSGGSWRRARPTRSPRR